MYENLKGKKIAILHDYFLYKGGGERLVCILAKELNATVITAFIAKNAFDPRDDGVKVIELYKESFISNINGGRYLQVNLAFLLKTKKILKDFDIIIYSGDCLIALLNAKDKLNVAYLHTPPRHLYDLHRERLLSYKGLNWFKRPLFLIFSAINRWRFEFLVKKFDLIITNSKTVQDRISHFLGLKSKVAYPPCDGVPVAWNSPKDYYLSWARLDSAKRVDKIAQAFAKMPDKRLVIGSSGPELDKIKSIAQNHKNIEVLGWIDDQKLQELLSSCIATIYIPIREDFGMSPVESMLAGKPVIGVNEGGLRETIINNKTGILLDPTFTEVDIINAVNRMDTKLAESMKEMCIKRAKEFSTFKFIDSVNSYLSTSLRDKGL